jgi:hypothetical protein
MQDFALFSEDAEQTFSPKKKHCFHADREDIVPNGSEENPPKYGLSSLSKVDLQNQFDLLSELQKSKNPNDRSIMAINWGRNGNQIKFK